MDNTKEAIISSITNILKEKFNINCIVEFTDNVNKRVEELNKQYSKPFSDLIPSDKRTGVYLLSREAFPAYIIINEERTFSLYVMTAFHELKHAMDLEIFKRAISDKENIDNDILGENSLYFTFNYYSEFEAIRFGIINYFKTVTFIGTTKEEVVRNLAESYKKVYEQDLKNTKYKFEYIFHTLAYMASLTALAECDKTFIIDSIIEDILDIEFIKDTVNLMYEDTKNKNWYINFDKKLRDYFG